MNCIGNIDENKSMFEQIDEYSIPGKFGGSYDVKDLKPIDKEFIRGMAWMVDVVDQYEPFFDEESTLGKIKKEIADEVLGDVVRMLIASIGEMLFGIMDGDEDYWERDSQKDEVDN